MRADTGALRVAVEGDALVVAGKSGGLRRLAHWLALYAKHNDLEEPGMHCHIDPSDWPAGDAWIAADSLPLVVAGWVPER